jgi:hypothetical protein
MNKDRRAKRPRREVAALLPELEAYTAEAKQ